MTLINGTFGKDILTGTPETDSIFGDLDDDALNGLGGADEFVFNNVIGVFHLDEVYVYSSDGFDIIKNFSSDSDKIININPVNHHYEHVNINYDAGSIIGLGATSTKEFSYDRNTGALYFQRTKFATLKNKPNFIRSLDSDLVNTHVDTGVKMNHDVDSIIRLGATSTKEFSYNRNTSALSLQENQFATLENKHNLIHSLDGQTS